METLWLAFAPVTDFTEVPAMHVDTVKKLVIYLSLAFVVVSVWHDPSGSAAAAGGFLHLVGTFFSTVLHKGTTFVKGLAH